MSFITKIADVNGEKMYLAVGVATRDAETRLVGEKQTNLTKFGIAVGKKPDGSDRFADCVAWRKVAYACENIKKGDVIACLGKIEEREYNEKKYYDFVLDWANPMVYGAPASAKAAEPASGFMSDLQNVDEGELPF